MAINQEAWEWDQETLTITAGCIYKQGIGFSGEKCGRCKARINLIGGGAAYFCPRCGGLVVTPLYGFKVWWDKPDYGPSANQLRKVYKQIEKEAA